MTKRPNFLFIITDQHRADHLGCYGNTIVQTPNIDNLAAAGRSFDRFYVANPICMPNRAAIMTGRVSSLNGVRHNGISLSRGHTTFVELLRSAGYRTGLVGKSHLQSFTGLPATNTFTSEASLQAPPEELREAHKNCRRGFEYELENSLTWDRPLRERWVRDFYGFDHFEVVAEHGDRASGDYLLWARKQFPGFDELVGPENALPNNQFKAPQAWRTAVPGELYSTSWIGKRAEAFLEQAVKADEPFFLQMSFPDPHHPFTPPGHYWGMYDPADIELPKSFGKGQLPPIREMRKALAAGLDPRDNQNPFAVTEAEARAIIALTYSMITMIDDQIGKIMARLKELGLEEDTVVIFTSDHGDFMGDHGLMLKLLLHYQGLIRVPFIWRDPEGPLGDRDAGLASSIDISATILKRAGLQPYNGIQGRDLIHSSPPSAVLIEEDSQRTMIGFNKLQRVRSVVTDRWRMSLRQGEEWDELYDLEADPQENHNLYDDPKSREVRQELTDLMLRKTIELQDTSPLPAYRA